MTSNAIGDLALVIISLLCSLFERDFSGTRLAKFILLFVMCGLHTFRVDIVTYLCVECLYVFMCTCVCLVIVCCVIS